MDGLDALPCYDHLYSVSDLHFGGYSAKYENETVERNYRIFNQGKALAWWVGDVIKVAKENPRTALVLNGDVVDFLARENANPFDPENCLPYLRRIVEEDEAFKPVWEQLQRFVTSKTGDLVIVLGNHDVELALTSVQNYLLHYLTNGDRSARAHIVLAMDGRGFRCRVGSSQVLCVHGNEVDDFNAVDYGSLGLVARALNFDDRTPEFTVNAGSTLVTAAMNFIKKRFQWVDLIKPETQGVARVLGALPRELFHELPLKSAMTAVARILVLKARDKKRIESGLLGGTIHDDADFEQAVATRANALLGHYATTNEGTIDAMIERVQRELGTGKRPIEFLSGETGEQRSDELLNVFDDVWGALTNNLETKKNNLREALTKALAFDTSFSPTAAPDDALDQLDARIGTGIHFLLAGHTHFEKSLERKRSGTYYFNSGTWIRLVDLRKYLADADFDLVWNVLLDGSMESLDGLRGAPEFKELRPGGFDRASLPVQKPITLTMVTRTVVHVRAVSASTAGAENAPAGSVIGELLHVVDAEPGSGGEPFALTPVKLTRRIVNF